MNPDDVLRFWIDEVGPERWYGSSEKLDTEIRNLFEPTWQQLKLGSFSLWLTYPTGALAYIILADQFPRNMFRGTGLAYATDKIAIAAAKSSIKQCWDMRIDEPARQFFYLPLMHSENLCDQDRCVRLMSERMKQTGASNLLHAQAHREIIRAFGRFPYRNEALQRRFTHPEREFIDQGGYGATLNQLAQAS